MNILLRAYVFSIVFLKIVGAKVDYYEISTLVQDVQKFYLARSIFIVYDKQEHDFTKEIKLLNAIKRHSRQFCMSQAITYENLSRLPPRRENVLRALGIYSMKNLQHAINATKNTDMSLNPWLLLIFLEKLDFDCNRPRKDFFKLKMDTKMAAKCKDSNVLKRYYSVFDNQTEVIDLAEWSSEKKLEFKDSQKLHEVETDMKGITLKVARRDIDIEEASEYLTNFLLNLTSELETFGNFKTEVTIRDASMGYYDNKTKLWRGLTHFVYKNEVDIGMFLFSMSNKRLKAVDFAAPIVRSRYYLFAKLPEAKTIHWTAYFEAFDWYTWEAMALSILIASIILTLIKSECQGNLISNFFGNFVNIWGIYCQQGLADPPSNTPIKIIFFSLLVSSLILNAIYSATITSYITLLSPTLPFSNYEEFKRDTSYEVTVLKNSADEILFYHYEYLKPLQSRLKSSCELPIDPYEGFEQSCEPKTAFYSDEVTFAGINKYSLPCQLGQLDMEQIEYMSLILTKNSPYTKTISYFITRLRDHGILKRLKNTYSYKYIELPDNQPNVIRFEEFLPILAVWIIGVVLTLIVWLFELMMFYLPSLYRSTETE